MVCGFVLTAVKFWWTFKSYTFCNIIGIWLDLSIFFQISIAVKFWWTTKIYTFCNIIGIWLDLSIFFKSQFQSNSGGFLKITLLDDHRNLTGFEHFFHVQSQSTIWLELMPLNPVKFRRKLKSVNFSHPPEFDWNWLLKKMLKSSQIPMMLQKV